MITLQQIKDNVAKAYGFEGWDDISDDIKVNYFDEVAMILANTKVTEERERLFEKRVKIQYMKRASFVHDSLPYTEGEDY